jgi:hypothetical protein
MTRLLPSIRLHRRSSAAWRENSNTGFFLFETAPLSVADMKNRDEELAYLSRKGKRVGVINGYLSGEELSFLKRQFRKDWRAHFARMAVLGPVMTRGNYAGDPAYAPAQALAAVTGGTANVLWWTPSVYTPIPANAVQAPATWRMTAGGLVTSSSTSQTITMNSNVGTAVGTGLGSSTALALGSTITNAFWRTAGDLTVRTSGSSGTAVGNFLIHWGTTAGASATVSNALWGGGNTVQTLDFQSTAQGLAIGATPSAAAISVTPTYVHFANWD